MQETGLKLNLGSGKDFKEDYLNADIQSRVEPDWVLDICDLKMGQEIVTRFGKINIQPGMFTEILALDVLEHVSDLVKCMRNCLDLLAPGGEMKIVVPYDLSIGAWSDPTHVRAFNERSWVYYCAWSWYLGWTDRFDMEHLEYRLSEYGSSLKLSQDELVRMPRAVDSMFLILKKAPNGNESSTQY